ncbi:MAG: hypothetical protein LBV51_01405 [Acholeplasmatales bacterium]|jgi:Na+/H+-translocating membrane pyrophosphatase|nr:hypothetical protein [Acholeplasmatales bacterium]
MQIIASREKITKKKALRNPLITVSVTIFMAVCGIVFTSLDTEIKSMAKIFYYVAGFGAICIVIFRIRVAKLAKLPGDLVLYDENTQTLELHPDDGSVITKNIKNLIKVTAEYRRNKYTKLSDGTLTLEFENTKYAFRIVIKLRKAYEKLLELQEKNK